MRLRPIEHLENRRPKCKMHTQERQLTRFVFYNWSTKKTNQTDGFSKPNRTRGFSQNRNELEKSVPHIPSCDKHDRCVFSLFSYMHNTSRQCSVGLWLCDLFYIHFVISEQ